jgi:hypothetical protein
MTATSHREIENRGAAPKLSIATLASRILPAIDTRVAVNAGGYDNKTTPGTPQAPYSLTDCG